MKIAKSGMLVSVMMIFLVLSIASLGTFAYFNDVETSGGNVFTAGTLDLTVDDQNGVNVVKFNVGNFRPGNQPRGAWELANVRSIGGYLDLVNIVVTDNENVLTEPEIEAGDNTPNIGELSSLVGLTIGIDLNRDGWIDGYDIIIYNGVMNGIASGYNLDYAIPAGESICFRAEINWWSNRFGNDNLAQSDSAVLDIEFRLDQIV